MSTFLSSLFSAQDKVQNFWETCLLQTGPGSSISLWQRTSKILSLWQSTSTLFHNSEKFLLRYTVKDSQLFMLSGCSLRRTSWPLHPPQSLISTLRTSALILKASVPIGKELCWFLSLMKHVFLLLKPWSHLISFQLKNVGAMSLGTSWSLHSQVPAFSLNMQPFPCIFRKFLYALLLLMSHACYFLKCALQQQPSCKANKCTIE